MTSTMQWRHGVALGAVYVLAGKLGLHFAALHPSASALWPPTGIALAGLLLGGSGLWPAVFVAAFLVNITTAESAGTSLGIATGNTLEALTGAFLVRRYAGGLRAFAQPWTIFTFTLGAGVVAPVVSATIGVASLVAAGSVSAASVAPVWLTWWLGDATGALIVAPLLVAWAPRPRLAVMRGRLAEIIVLAAVTVGLDLVVFGGVAPSGVPLAFACLPPLVWAAYRFGARGATASVLALALIGTVGTVRGAGPFAGSGPNDALLLLQLFLATMSATTLPLAALADELARRESRSEENARLFRESEGQRLSLASFARASLALAPSLEVRDVAARIAESVRELLNGTTALVFKRSAASDAYDALAMAGDAGPPFTADVSVPAGEGAIGVAVREMRPIVSADVTSDDRVTFNDALRRRLVQNPCRAVLAVPLVAEGVAVGVFLVVDRVGRRFTPEEVLLAEAFAHHAALAIANAQRFEDVRSEEQALSHFFEDAAVPLHWVGPDGVIMRANAAELAMLGYTRDDYVGRHIADFHVDRETIAEMLRRLAARETLRDYPARLRARDGSIRHVVIDSNVQWEGERFVHTRCFTRDVTSLRLAEAEMTRLLDAERAARAEAEAAERQMAVLDEIARSITSSLDLGVVLQRITRGAQELCASDTAAIFLRDGDSDAMVPSYRVGPPVRAYATLRIEPGQGIGGHVLLTGRPLRTDAYRMDDRVPAAFHAIADETGTVALMVVPIKIHGRIEGLLYINNETPRPFTERDEAVCMRLAEQAAVAIRNARLFADAQAASRAKDDFLAMLSHELRTPLNAIVGWARMLRAGSLTPDLAAKAVDVIDRNAAAQVQLIEDLLDVSRIVSGKLRLQVAPVNASSVVAAALDALRPTAERKGVRLVPDVGGVAEVVMGDAGRLQQVVWNLLTNAVKFTPAGGTITVKVEGRAAGVTISVTDTGIGIDVSALPYIFERFRQADSSMTRQHGGLGLGLALVKHIVDLHGGTVEASSDGPGRGATFTITLPAARPEKTELRALPEGVGPVKLASVSVLVVDDDADARELCAAVLVRHGATVATAASAAEALDRVEVMRPDVVVADLGMPDEDGFGFIRRLRARESAHGRRTSVVALTAFVTVDDRQRALDAGFDVHVAKPFDPVELAMTIRGLLP